MGQIIHSERITFKYEVNEGDDKVVTISFDASNEDIHDIVEKFQGFVQAIGFNYIDGEKNRIEYTQAEDESENFVDVESLNLVEQLRQKIVEDKSEHGYIVDPRIIIGEEHE